MNSNSLKLSIVTPVYQSEECLFELYDRLTKAISKITKNFEIIMVNDGSLDNSWKIIENLAQKDTKVKGINLSRNFGQHYAIIAGLNHAKGKWIVVMDCDLQDRPDEIPNLYKKTQEGYDIVFARRVNRKDRFTKRLYSMLFYSVYMYMSGITADKSIANFGIYHAKVIDEYNKMKEVARSFPTLVQYLGFKSCAIDVKHSERIEGNSTYTISKLFALAGNIIISNSNKPLKLTIKLGFLISIFSFIIAFYNLIAFFIGMIKVPGFTTTVFSIWFVGGLIITILGIVGLYIDKIFNQVKGRQLFIVSDLKNIEK